jgi:hypothetical protein
MIYILNSRGIVHKEELMAIGNGFDVNTPGRGRVGTNINMIVEYIQVLILK